MPWKAFTYTGPNPDGTNGIFMVARYSLAEPDGRRDRSHCHRRPIQRSLTELPGLSPERRPSEGSTLKQKVATALRPLSGPPFLFCSSPLSLVKRRPTLLRGFPYGPQTRRRQLPLLGLRRCHGLRLLLFLRRPSRSLGGGDPSATRFADRATLLRTRVIRSSRGRRGYRGLWPARTALPELLFDIGYLRGDLFDLALIPDDGHLQDGAVYFWLCLSWHFGSPI